MKQKIIGFDQDEEFHWVADLGCGHTQHVHHDPPLTLRPWVTTPEGRRDRIGAELECRKLMNGAVVWAWRIYDQLRKGETTMPDDTARRRLKQKVLERWENEGGKIESDPKGAPGNNPTTNPESETDHLSQSSKNPTNGSSPS